MTLEDVQREKEDAKRTRMNWENRFQTWSNEQSYDGTTHCGKCGYGVMCDYCEDSSYGRPCVRALNQLIKVAGVKVNYKIAKYCDIWNGKFSEG